MSPDCYLWYELCDTFEENYSFIKNELEHYSIVFSQKNITNLHQIVQELIYDLDRVYHTYLECKVTLDDVITQEGSDWQTYHRFSVMKYLLHDIWERFKYIIYSIFDQDIRIRLDYDEIIKNHVVSRNLCRYFIQKIRNNHPVTVEAYFGYDLSYYWVSLTKTQKGIINAPRINSYCTRLLPIYCHEISHPIIELNTREILENVHLKSLFISVHDYILKHYIFTNEEFTRENAEKAASSVFTEMLADIMSVLVCQDSYIFAFCTSELWPRDKIYADYWILGGYWKSHPPNELRFLLCNEILRMLGKNEVADLIESDWDKINTLQDNYVNGEYSIALYLYIEDFLKEIKLGDVVKALTDIDSPLSITPHAGIGKYTLEEVTEKNDPIEILNAIWNTRYTRFTIGENLEDRLTTQALKKLHYSLTFRRD